MKQVNFGYTDTPINGVTTLSLSRGLLNFKADFSPVNLKNGEATVTNVTSPQDRPEKIRFASSKIDNVYKGSGISPSVQAPSVRGTNLLVQLTEVASITDPTDASYRVDVPISAHIVLKVPAIEQITEDHIIAVVGRLISGLFETGKSDSIRLARLVRGSLLPADL